jgi:hypothetical protein
MTRQTMTMMVLLDLKMMKSQGFNSNLSLMRLRFQLTEPQLRDKVKRKDSGKRSQVLWILLETKKTLR